MREENVLIYRPVWTVKLLSSTYWPSNCIKVKQFEIDNTEQGKYISKERDKKTLGFILRHPKKIAIEGILEGQNRR